MSASMVQSPRQEGTVSVLPLSSKPSEVSVSAMNSRGISVPSRALMRLSSSSMNVVSGSLASTSIVPSYTSPAPSISTSSHARSTAGTVANRSRPFSNRPEASVRMPRAMAVLRMEWPRKLALSKTMVVVSSVISLFAPPITPASATGPSGSAMTSMPGVRAWSLPSSVRRDSPSSARRTMILPSCRQA